MKTIFQRAFIGLGLAVLLLGVTMGRAQAFDQSESYMGSIELFAGNFEPQYWMACDGRLLNIAQFQSLFALLDCTFGGDCLTTFGLPDLRGRVPIGAFRGLGLTNRIRGQLGGEERHLLTTTELPLATAQAADGSGVNTQTIAGGQSHNNMGPYLGIRYIICVDGLWPPRD